MLDYGCYPVWLYDEDGDLIDTLLPEEIRSNEDLDLKFTNLQERYEALFINNPKEFSYIGFKDEYEKEKFLSDWKEAVEELKICTNGIYEISDEIKRLIN